jgi:hypothetical protein
MLKCRATVLQQLHVQQEIAEHIEPFAPHYALMRLLSVGLNTFNAIDRHVKDQAKGSFSESLSESVTAQMLRYWEELAAEDSNGF